MEKLRPFIALLLFLSLASVLLPGCEKESQDSPVNPITPKITTNPVADTTVSFGSDNSISWESQGLSSITVKVDGEVKSNSTSGSIPILDIKKEIVVEISGFDKNNEPIVPKAIRFMPQSEIYPKPTITLTSDPEGKLPSGGGNVIITWFTTNADSVLYDGEWYPPYGSIQRTITDTTTFVFLAKGKGGQTSVSKTVPVDPVIIPPPLTQEEILSANPRTFFRFEYRYLEVGSEWIDNPLSACQMDNILTFYINHDCTVDDGENLCSGESQTLLHFTWFLENGHIFDKDIVKLTLDTLIWTYPSFEILEDGITIRNILVKETWVNLEP